MRHVDTVEELKAFIGDEPHAVISTEGEWASIAVRVKIGTHRSGYLFLTALKLFIRAAWTNWS